MDAKQLFTIFRNHTHTGAYPDAKKLPPWALGLKSTIGFGLISPNNTRWLLGIADDGVVTCSPIPYSLLLTGSDGSLYAIGVDSDGVVTAGPASIDLRGVVFARSFPLVDSLGNAWSLGVDNDGALTTTPG